MFDDNLKERLELALGRIAELESASSEGCFLSDEAYADNEEYRGFLNEYFGEQAAFLLYVNKVREKRISGEFEKLSYEELKKCNKALYGDVADGMYESSFTNPRYIAGTFEEMKIAPESCAKDLARELAFLAYELRSVIAHVFEKKDTFFVTMLELYLQAACEAESGSLNAASLKEILYWFVSDTSDDFMEDRTADQLIVGHSGITQWIAESDLSKPDYLYKIGEYVTEDEERLAAYLGTLPEEEISRMAATFTEGYKRGFILGGKPFEKKKTVSIRYELGFERLVREEMKQFKAMGLETTIYRAAANVVNRRQNIKIGFFGASPDEQMEYDHRFDDALFLDSKFVERKIGAVKLAYEKYAKEADVFGGPACMDTFGEVPFEPEDFEEVYHRTPAQQALNVSYSNESNAIVNQYIKGEERSFTIIAYPKPQIGDLFEQVFKETADINSLDYEKYKGIQQALIDVLDEADHVEVKGAGTNQTDITVKIQKVQNPANETVFENCLADVNIPLGEVFTSPVLAGTTGTIHVSSVYLNDLQFKNLKVTLKDGMVCDYSNDNFEDEEKSKAYFKENVLFGHETLPIGEFAIGTNTTAYAMGKKYDIIYKLPILIVEKMGPHFALGDTCYSRSEEVATFNPDGKKIVCTDNEVSLLRKTDPSKAYFNCHTDITIPYEEIGVITAVKADGTRVDLIRDGRFVLDGTEELNRPLEA